MPAIELSFRDFIWIGSLLVTVALSYGKLKSEIRHLDDTKAEQRDVARLGEELRAQLGQISTSLARLEESIRLLTRSNETGEE